MKIKFTSEKIYHFVLINIYITNLKLDKNVEIRELKKESLNIKN